MLDALSIAQLHAWGMKHEYTPDGVPGKVKQAEGRAVKALWDRRQRQPNPKSQAEFNAEMSRSSGYLPQFFSGKRPITLDLAHHFAKYIGCEIREFSQRLAIEDAQSQSLVEWPFPDVDYYEIKNLPEWAKVSLQGKIKTYLAKRKAREAARGGHRNTARKSNLDGR